LTTTTFDKCLSERAERDPDACALVGDGDAIRYRDLDRRVAEVAARLAAAGVGVGDRVVVVADNSPGHLVVAFAVWRAGATLVTIYPSSGASELAFAVGSTEPALVVAGSRVIGAARTAAAGCAAPVAELTESGALRLLDGDAGVPADRRPIDASALALVCFTSGSTSRPKAVMHTHAGLLAAATSYACVWHLDHNDTTLIALPLAWAFGLVTASMATLTAGGQVVVVRRADPVELLRRVAAHRVTFLPGVTTIFLKLLDVVERHQPRPDVSSLRLCISGGEPRNEAAFTRWEAITGCPVHDVYAASECFPVVTYDPLRDPRPRPGAAGRVVDGAQLRVVGPDGTDLGVNDVGEAWTRGPAMTAGYWRDPELTRAALTADGWYRTGDLVHVDDDGYVHVVGRLSDMIIRGGANVSPAEVEAVVTAHDDIQEAAVVGVPHPEYGQEVVAAVVVEPGRQLDERRLLDSCAAELAGYKVPTRVVVVDRLPRNEHTGKVQRRDVVTMLTTPTSPMPAERRR
jgi:long-chain acyl-CoA synthetase